ncbi:adenosine/AMP deaminase-like protein [Methylacidiphilum kamchatkense Kam1]|uniref:adenosine deaminase n=2 Tax=Methylacidiphilum kamchatkense TaxID=431057 RepID=A0A516TMR9_9BACT|nr:adenosine/AMP deaminase-like protein [Methylacidiphilum kamchatkense Kam1]
MKLGDANGSKLLKEPGCLEKQCQLLYEELCKDGVIYAEIRCSPNNYADPTNNRSAWVILQEIREHFQKAMDKKKKENPEAFCQINLIIIADRKSPNLSSLSRHLSLAITANQHFPLKWGNCAVVGVDLAGFESKKTRAELFSYDFTLIHRCGIAVTAHAGENDDAEGIWQAIFKLHARRLGHALSLNNSQDLLRTVVDRHIAIEMCPYANFQIKGFSPMEGKPSYPGKNILKEFMQSFEAF